jgi:hypothetical protein
MTHRMTSRLVTFTFGGGVALVVLAASAACEDSAANPQSPALPSSSSSGTPAGNTSSSSGTSTAGTSGGAEAGADSGALDVSRFVAAVCAYEERCHGATFKRNFGDLTRCKSVYGLGFRGESAAKGWATTEAQLDACVAAMPDACEFLEYVPACRFVGTLATGAGCIYGSQCATGACIGVEDANGCDRCAPRATAGTDCATTYCSDKGYDCYNGKCTLMGGESASCGGDALPCQSHLRCVGGQCVKALPKDASCTQVEGQQSPCDTGLECVSNKCAEELTAPVGQPCGSTSGRIVRCIASRCQGGTCVAYRALDESCNESARCDLLLRCVAGKCALPDPNACN